MKKKQMNGLLLATILLAGASQAALIAYDGFVTEADADAVNGIYDTGQDLAGIANANVAGGTIVGFNGAWTASAFYDAYAQKMRLIGRTQTSAAWADRALSSSMIGKTEAYASVVMRVDDTPQTGGIVLSGFSDATLSSTKGASVGYKWDGANWDLILRYRDAGGATLVTVKEDVAANTYNTIVWGMNDVTDTINVWINPTDINSVAALTVNDYAGEVGTITHYSGYHLSTGSGQDAYIDDITLGDTMTDVGVVPEPATIGMMGFATLLLLGLRRLRQ